VTGDPLKLDRRLAEVLDDYPAPSLPIGFADRVLAAITARPGPLPEPRPAASTKAPKQRRRTGRRLVLGALGIGALATAAAATGMLDDLPIAFPSAQKVWSTITGQEPDAAASAPAVTAFPALVPQTDHPVVIEGPIDTPEELEEVFKRIDRVRDGRREMRRAAADRRIDTAIVRRRENGLPVPSPEREARLRERIDALREREDIQNDASIEVRRGALRESVETGEQLTREDFLRRPPEAGSETSLGDRVRRLHTLPPAERRERLRQSRERRLDRLGQQRGGQAAQGDAVVQEQEAGDQIEAAETVSVDLEPLETTDNRQNSRSFREGLR
jgi:hypothetical protein